MVWVYALVFFMIASAVKIGIYRLLEYKSLRHEHHLLRIEGHVST